MSEPSNIDFTKGIDMTGVNPATAANFNTLVDNAQPYSEANPLEGKGLFIVTKDDFDGSPFPPDPTVNDAWKRYFWVRVDYNEAAARKVYIWNDSLTPDVTYYKWTEFLTTTALQAEVDALQVDVATLQSAQANQASQLNAVSGVANSAQADATEALAAIPAIESLTEAVTVTLPAADATNAAAAAAAQVTASQANTNALAVASTTRFQSPADYALAAGTVIANIAHGLGAVPKHYKWVLVCQAGGDAGYTEGDEVDVVCFEENSGNYQAFAFGCSATNVFLIQSNQNTVRVLNKASGVFSAIVLATWKARCYAWKG